jgi:glycerol-3-phosphate dehydrogenase (NAD(P)+)
MMGIECAAVLKNIYAIAAGMCRGLGYGDNIIAVLISNALQEMTDFMQRISPMIGGGDFNADGRLRQFESFAYLGDLLVTSYSQFSRNRTFGNMLGYGYTVKSAQLEMKMVAEGYYGTKCIKEINQKYGIQIPIVDCVYNILYKRMSPFVEFKLLSDMLR